MMCRPAHCPARLRRPKLNVFDPVRWAVESWLGDHPEAGLRADRAICLDVANRRIDGRCYLFFGGRSDTPLLVVKAARTVRGREVFEAEYRNLELLHERGLSSGATPQPLGRAEEDGTLVTLQSALPGALLKNLPGAERFSPTRIDSAFDDVIGFWERLQRAFEVRRVALDSAAYEREVLAPIRRFVRSFRLDADERELLEQRFERERSLFGVELPWMVRHGDFCAANMVETPSGLGVFDWESPLEHAMPLFDLFYFFSSLRFPYNGPHRESTHLESFRSVWWDESYFASCAWTRLLAACGRHALAPEALGDLFVLSLVQVGNMKFQSLLDAHDIETDMDRPLSEKDRDALWAAFEDPDSDRPFASIRDGVLENLRIVARRGVPSFGDAS